MYDKIQWMQWMIWDKRGYFLLKNDRRLADSTPLNWKKYSEIKHRLLTSKNCNTQKMRFLVLIYLKCILLVNAEAYDYGYLHKLPSRKVKFTSYRLDFL